MDKIAANLSEIFISSAFIRFIVLAKKELYSHRAGQSAQTEYKFSQTEFSHKLRVFKEIDFDDYITCVNVSNSNFMIRVNGKAHWTGNSSNITL